MRRDAVFARQGWYPQDPDDARTALTRYLTSDQPPSPAVAVIAPHAGWVYSGSTAGRLYAEVEVPNRVIVLCPMHQAIGPRVAVWAAGAWETPLGAVPVDEDFAEKLLAASDLASVDYASHLSEHAIEIQVPFLKARNDALRIVPVRLGHLRGDEVESLGAVLAKLIDQEPEPTLIVASSDMSHESDYDLVRRNDRLARDQIAALDATGLMNAVAGNAITMCGYIPAAVAIQAARRLGAQTAREVAYTTSADISGRRDYVVGYLAARFDR